jgi:hypothetical protein
MAQLLASLTLTAVCFAIGVRLLRLAQRTRQAPEFLIGSSFLLSGFIANGLTLFRLLAPISDGARMWLYAGATVSMNVGVLCIAAFTWRVFRPVGRAGSVACTISAIALVVVAGAEISAQAQLARGVGNPWTIWCSLPLRMAIYAWATCETLGYWWKLRRRQRIGLADPLVVNRLFLWGAGLLAILGVWIRLLVLAMGAAEGRELMGSVATTTLVLLCAILHWLAFFTPAAWKRRFTRVSNEVASA